MAGNVILKKDNREDSFNPFQLKKTVIVKKSHTEKSSQ